MVTKYTHLELNKDYLTGIAGYYTPQKEVRLKYNGREFLYVVGKAVIEAACCGSGSWPYVIVPGYITKWQNIKNEDGLLVSEVEPIPDEQAQGSVRRMIQTEGVPSSIAISFW
ncbi:hypothetical protein ACFLT8_06985 [Chloroflexota bacterium]